MIIKKWKILDSEIKFKAHVFRYKSIKAQSPNTGNIGNFDIVECLNWVNVLAITDDQKVVFVKQYRYGVDDITLELPGGAIEIGEDPFAAAQRELAEESGFSSNNWKKLGTVSANPAFMNNHCDTYLALDAKKTSDLKLDQFEEIEVVLIDLKEVKGMIQRGEINHSLIVAAFCFYFLDLD